MSNSLQLHRLQHASLPCPFLESAHTHVHWDADASQPSHPLLPLSPPALNFSQHQGLFQLISSLHLMARILVLQLQHQPFWWRFRFDFLSEWLVWSPHCPRGSQKSSPTPQLKSISSLVLSFLYCPTFTSWFKQNKTKQNTKLQVFCKFRS